MDKNKKYSRAEIIKGFQTDYKKEFGEDITEEETIDCLDRLAKLIKAVNKFKWEEEQRKKAEEEAKAKEERGEEEPPSSPQINKTINGRENIPIAERYGKLLKNRTPAEPLKEKLLSNIKNGLVTKLNFKGVIGTDVSFIDEAVVKVVIEVGEEQFNHSVVVTNANKQIKEMIKVITEERRELMATKSSGRVSMFIILG